MRNPTENGLASMQTPRSCSIVNVSRALWPSASTTWSASICCPPDSVTPRIERDSPLPSIRTSVTRAPKRTSPPSASISARIFSTMPTSRNVPMCGLPTQRISSGAPARTNSVSTFRVRKRGSLIWLQSLPSLKVPAPPSPNCTFDSGFRIPLRQRPQVSCVRSRTCRPRSSTMGRSPICARTSAAKMPHGPNPMTSGRSRPRAWKSAGA